MKTRAALSIRCATLALVTALCASCSSNNPAGPSASICLSVSGFYATVNHVWRGGGNQTENVQGLISFNSTVSSNNETHVFQWTNIVNNYTTFTTTSFNVNVDGVNYSYPANRCQ